MDLLVLLGILAIGGTVGGLALALRASLFRVGDEELDAPAPVLEALDPSFRRRAVAAALGRLDPG